MTGLRFFWVIFPPTQDDNFTKSKPSINKKMTALQFLGVNFPSTKDYIFTGLILRNKLGSNSLGKIYPTYKKVNFTMSKLQNFAKKWLCCNSLRQIFSNTTWHLYKVESIKINRKWLFYICNFLWKRFRA